jgi:hypothetical protein
MKMAIGSRPEWQTIAEENFRNNSKLEDLEENGSLGFIFHQKIRISPDIAGQIICIASRLCSYQDFILNPFILRLEKMRSVRPADPFS